ncbi:NADH-quinone oxidoreductase subunit C [Desulfobaculum senezii]|uniref:NADH-quinone oxidoreductase subunit C n=1 Tax=Desulfobaculum sp. SPO524 TaxID=3378071 RepID=UPI0038534452
MIENLKEVTKETVANEILMLKNDGYRLVAMSCTEVDDDTVDILYHMDKDLELVNLRMMAEKAKPVPSISGIYFCAMLSENEMRDQFALDFDGLVLDFNRSLLLDEEISTTQVPLTNNVKITKQ